MVFIGPSCWVRSDMSDAMERVQDQLLKRAAKAFRVHRRHVELPYAGSQRAMIEEIV